MKIDGAKEVFLKISKAFDALNDDNKRARYDAMGVRGVDDSAGGGAHNAEQFAHDIFKKMFEGFFDMDDIFGEMMGGGGRGGGASDLVALPVRQS